MGCIELMELKKEKILMELRRLEKELNELKNKN